jgi:hypothetical protein
MLPISSQRNTNTHHTHYSFGQRRQPVKSLVRRV